MTHKVSLIVQPGDSFFPIVRAIDRAERSINLTVYRMDDPIILKALVEAQKRGVQIRLLIATSALGWQDKNRKLLKDAKKAGIATKEPSGDRKKARYHYKVMTVDNSVTLIFTFNPTRENLHYTRDFGVELHNSKVASEIDRLFFADWHDISFTPDPDSPLLISPFNSREKMTSLLAAAEKSIHIADAKLKDPAIVELLVEKAKSGVEVRVLGDEEHGRKLPPAIASRATPRFKLHAKCTIIDGAHAVIGSMNMRTESFDRRREVSIVVENADVIKRLNAVFISDWENRAHSSARDVTVIAIPMPVLSSPEVKAETGFVLLSRTDALARYKLRQGQMSVGRADDNDITISDPLVSRHHAQITIDEGDCTVTDLESGNGTFINGERLQGTAKLNQGDVVDFGGADEFRLVTL